MKFLCVDCDEAMKLERTGGPDDGSMTVLFACPSCGRQVAMLTNSMETQMVRSLGVKIGAGSGNSVPMETLRGSLAGAHSEVAPNGARDEDAGEDRNSGLSGGGVSKEAPGLPGLDAGHGFGTDNDAESAGGKCPFTGVVNEAFANDARSDAELVWTADALERLDRIPAYVRAMVEKGIVEYAREQGVNEIDGALMDEARGRFGM